MQTVINVDPTPGIVEACNYGYIYATVLGIICFATTLSAARKRNGTLTLSFIQFTLAVVLALSYSTITNDIKLMAGKTGLNATLMAHVDNITCVAPTACQCVSQCSNYTGWTCNPAPCFINYTSVLGVTQCVNENVPCYNQTVISSLSINGKIYLYENSTYTYALPPATPQDQWVKFFPWSPTTVVNNAEVTPMFVFAVLLLSMILMNAYIVIFVRFENEAEETDTEKDAQKSASDDVPTEKEEIIYVYPLPYKI